MKIGILGGSFNPVHKGHLLIASSAMEQFALNKVIFVPALVSPHKQGEVDLLSPKHRYAMVQLAIKGLKDFEVSDVELKRGGISYTIDTIEFFLKEYPGAKLFLILGADSFSKISTWRSAEKIKSLCHVLIAPRPGEDVSTIADMENYQKINLTECPISASAIRKKIASGEPVPSSELPESVSKYISEQRLYKKSMPCR